LQEGVYRSPFSLTEVRVLYELAHRPSSTAAELCKELGLDPGYLSRVLRGFDKRHYLEKKASASDARQIFLSLTPAGLKAFQPLDERSHRDVGKMLSQLAPGEQSRLVQAMETIQRLLEPRRSDNELYLLRPHQPGDMGWVTHRHGVLYSQEYGYDERFEALVAGIVAEFIANFDAKKERCWIAEKDGEIVGSVFLCKKSATVAKLRLLLVEPSARGLGIGKRLVAECIRFARQCGYKKMMLWTQSELKAARGIYQQAGFRLVAEKSHQSWGRDDLVAETWELKL
jgi:DNA-binding MarR family transcriptional regulator/GNAT superfamily N-acetyltransferase